MDFAFRFWLFDWFDPSARAGAHPARAAGGRRATRPGIDRRAADRGEAEKAYIINTMNSIAPCYLSRSVHRRLLRPSCCSGISTSRASDDADLVSSCHSRHTSSASRPLQHHSFTTSRRYHASRNLRSDSLLGHSPMGRSVPTTSQQARGDVSANNNKGPVWGTDSNTTGGGVWAQQSSKREKLSELLTDLNSEGVDTGEFVYTFSNLRK